MCCVTTLLNFQTALKAQLLKPEMVCHKGHSQINCMQAISNGYVLWLVKWTPLAVLLNGVMRWKILCIIKQVIMTFAIGMVHFRISEKLYLVGFNTFNTLSRYVYDVPLFLTWNHNNNFCQSYKNILWHYHIIIFSLKILHHW